MLVNANAKRGGRRVAVQIARALPGASVRLTTPAQEIDAWLRALPAAAGVLAAGGDGTAVALVNALARLRADGRPLPTDRHPAAGDRERLGARARRAQAAPLPRAAGRARAARCRRGAAASSTSKGRSRTSPGPGWDAMILDDYKRQLEASKGPGRHFSKSVYGYLSATLLRTAPKVAVFGNPHVVIENLGDRRSSRRRRRAPAPHARASGAAPCSTTGPSASRRWARAPSSATASSAFPFAERMPGFISVRAYSRGALGAVAHDPPPVEGAAPARGHARLARDARADDLLARGPAADRRRRVRDSAGRSSTARRRGRYRWWTGEDCE